MIRALTFDAAGTLIRPVPSYGGVYSRVTAEFGLRIPAEWFAEEFARAFRAVPWPLETSPEIERAQWEKVVRRLHDALPGDLDFTRWFRAVYSAFARKESWTPEPGAVETLQALRALNLRIAVLSNWDERLFPVLEAHALAPLVDRILIPPHTGWRKPAPEMFAEACRRLGSHPAETLHVGDSPDEDIAGARAAGLHAVHYRPGEPPALTRLVNLLHSPLLAQKPQE
ncbi:MAG: HAD-IA family hydrolase [Candidatus Brocadiae bacterium]|nr:HAD-IA family hydrolase [Candidatus Brocadiia bacterium]